MVCFQRSNVPVNNNTCILFDSDFIKYTIELFTGDEYGFVVLSTVRSQPIEEISNPDHVQPDRQWLLENIGFVADEHQTNVAITRSKYGLIIVGKLKKSLLFLCTYNYTLIHTGNRMLLEYDLKTWKPLIEHYRKKQCIRNGNDFPSRQDIATLPEKVRQALV